MASLVIVIIKISGSWEERTISSQRIYSPLNERSPSIDSGDTIVFSKLSCRLIFDSTNIRLLQLFSDRVKKDFNLGFGSALAYMKLVKAAVLLSYL
jgi:hypothetical protein